jgi:hypothetical protein
MAQWLAKKVAKEKQRTPKFAEKKKRGIKVHK